MTLEQAPGTDKKSLGMRSAVTHDSYSKYLVYDERPYPWADTQGMRLHSRYGAGLCPS